DWFISPELNFGQDFIFRFWCKADPDIEGYGDLWNTEHFQVGYSKTDNDPDSFIWMTDEPETVTTMNTEWSKKEYSMPADAKYVCIRYCTPQNGFWFMVDDVFIGIENTPAAVQRKEKKTPTFRAYDVYVDDKKVASVNESKHTLLGLEDGQHVAKVYAVYEEGTSEAAVVAFSTKTSGVGSVISENAAVYPNPASEKVFFGKEVEKATLFNLSGVAVASAKGANAMDLTNVSAGIYLLKLENNGNTQTVRLIVK
ncbi:MAG: choice-of-anchor J domain-containing protein, partial [Muribaculaceae bacterium]|nr:choice-of-anchor J domain-containing protein [Muribaculaceae bacterium]